jgi:GPH family glycoside/pentoside/hexuronide:cation symporter
VALVAAWAMRAEWGQGDLGDRPAAGRAMRAVLRDPLSRRLLLLALVNATPVAVTSTLFLFFVESRLGVPDLSGPLLLLFFLSAAASTPLWSRAAQRFGAKRALVAGMVLAVLTFGFAATLGQGDTLAFALICVASGAATVAPGAGAGFGLWNFVSKFTLAFVAAIVLPLLQARGFVSGMANPPEALAMLTLLYAVVPCLLKIIAIGLLVATPVTET